MKRFRTLYVAIFVVPLFAFLGTESDLCAMLKRTKVISQTRFEITETSIPVTKLTKISGENEKLLYNLESSNGDKYFVLGKFPIKANRVGVVSLRKTYECDHPMDVLVLSVVDNCKVVANTNLAIEDNHVISYKVSSVLNQKNRTISITTEYSSEYAIEADAKTDTTFTDVAKIDLRTMDTISKKSSYKVFKIQ